jgi:glycosyltransferase involved in cell wall biosynthesis
MIYSPTIENSNVELVAVIVTYNEEANVERALRSVHGLCPIVVVDSGSTDRTEEICRRYTDHFLTHRYENHAKQWSWAIDNCPVPAKWVLALDADFEILPDLRNKLQNELKQVPDDVDGIYVVHRYVFGGSEIRFGGAKKYWMRVVRRGSVSPDLSDLVDFRFTVNRRTINWNAIVREYNEADEDASFWIRKQDKFSLRLAVEEELRRERALHWETRPKLFGNSDERVMWLRDFWLRLPLFIRPCLYFAYRYLFRLGFLDGRGGFLYHAQQGFWMRLVVDWKLWQLRKYKLTGERLHRMKEAMLQTSSGSVRDVAMSIVDQAASAE